MPSVRVKAAKTGRCHLTLLSISRYGFERADKNFCAIDFVRGLAALIIVVFYYKNYWRGTEEPPVSFAVLKQQSWFNSVTPIFEHGALAVMLFWAISGFVMTHAYGGAVRHWSARSYLIACFARLWPLHLATLGYVAALQAFSMNALGGFQIFQFNDFYHFMLHVPMASHWGFQHGQSFNEPIWLLSAEVIAYLM